MNEASPGRSMISKRTSSRWATSSKQASASFSRLVSGSPRCSAPLSMTPRTKRPLRTPSCVENTGTREGGDRVVLGRLLAAAVAMEAALQQRQVFRLLARDDLMHLQRAGIDAEPAFPGVAHA